MVFMIGAGYPQTWAYQMSFAAAAGLTAVGFLIEAALLYRLKTTGGPSFSYRRNINCPEVEKDENAPDHKPHG